MRIVGALVPMEHIPYNKFLKVRPFSQPSGPIALILHPPSPHPSTILSTFNHIFLSFYLSFSAVALCLFPSFFPSPLFLILLFFIIFCISFFNTFLFCLVYSYLLVKFIVFFLRNPYLSDCSILHFFVYDCKEAKNSAICSIGGNTVWINFTKNQN